MDQKIKVYSYYVVELDCRLNIYAFDKNQADNLINLYCKNSKKNCMFLRISKSKKEMENMNRLIKKFGDSKNLIEKEYELLGGKKDGKR